MPQTDERVKQSLLDSSELKQSVAAKCITQISRAGESIVTTLCAGGKVLIFGNGGSAADAQHLAAEFVGRFVNERRPLAAIALTTDSSALTSIGNDYGFEHTFARQVEALGHAGDIAIAISTSGKSSNVLAGVKSAQAIGITTIGLTGGNGGTLAEAADISIIVPSSITARIQEVHITIGHIWCEMIDAAFTAASDLPLVLPQAKIVAWETLDRLRPRWKQQNQVVVWTNGCFDLLHVGHIRNLQAARQLGHLLVVGLNSDASVQRNKGKNRPIVPEQERAEVLAALTSVDYIVIFDEDTPKTALMRLKPDVHCKGMDYAPPYGKPIPEAAVVESYGGRIAFIPLIRGVSTTDLIRRIQGQGQG